MKRFRRASVADFIYKLIHKNIAIFNLDFRFQILDFFFFAGGGGGGMVLYGDLVPLHHDLFN